MKRVLMFSLLALGMGVVSAYASSDASVVPHGGAAAIVKQVGAVELAIVKKTRPDGEVRKEVVNSSVPYSGKFCLIFVETKYASSTGRGDTDHDLVTARSVYAVSEPVFLIKGEDIVDNVLGSSIVTSFINEHKSLSHTALHLYVVKDRQVNDLVTALKLEGATSALKVSASDLRIKK